MAGKDLDLTKAADDAAQTVVQAGKAVADKAAALKDDAVQAAAAAKETVTDAAVAAKETVTDAAVAAKEKAGEVVHAVGERIPQSSDEWEAVGRDIVDSIRRNPKPWLIGAGVFAVAWLLGRGSARTKP
ncbi:hypothetical protein [Catellatospora tritici]|uniref:hypothetical protein n=1 Tax=Catellatospora tritici TaxID=2851566 RepID=UPI001C2DAA3C|nr:hypothetical protein [Catellatospora tritici]MBV1856038.1 hypothetical protein [Catellatospora tritici]